MPSSNSTMSAEPNSAMPPDWARSLVSFLIFVHLFALLVAILGNWNPSRLASNLRDRVPFVKPYVEYLAMDQSYVPLYGFNFDMEEDNDNKIEVTLKLKDGTEKSWTLPSTKAWPRQRWRHDARLVETVADMTGEDYSRFQSLVPQAIAAHFVAKQPDAVRGRIRCTRQQVQPMASLSSSDPAERDPYDKRWTRQLYDARILITRGGVKLLKSESASEVVGAAAEESDK
jgi:hypothetical protein